MEIQRLVLSEVLLWSLLSLKAQHLMDISLQVPSELQGVPLYPF